MKTPFTMIIATCDFGLIYINPEHISVIKPTNTGCVIALLNGDEIKSTKSSVEMAESIAKVLNRGF